MAQYEIVREIPNLCRNNQMRDVFFLEAETDDPVAYVKANAPLPVLEVSEVDGSIVVTTGDGFGYICLNVANFGRVKVVIERTGSGPTVVTVHPAADVHRVCQ